MGQRNFHNGEIVYDMQEKPDKLYFLMRGELCLETELDIEQKIEFPIGMDQWQHQIKQRKVLYKIRIIQERELFGHQEIIKFIRANDYAHSIKRECRVKATAES